MEDDDFVIIPREDKVSKMVSQETVSRYLTDIDNFVESVQNILWPLNEYIHNNPELAFEERKTHDALTGFMLSQDDWEVNPSAYGMKTAWVALYNTGKPGPVVSFNAEMGTPPLYWVRRSDYY